MRVLVVDDHILFREGLTSLLMADDYFQVVGQASSVQEAIDQTRCLKPDLILMDFSLPDGDGSEATSVILSEHPQVKIVFLTVYETDEKIFKAIRSGAKGYMLKNVHADSLVSALKSIDKGEAAISRSMTMRLMEEFSNRHDGYLHGDLPIHHDLSQREIEILHKMSEGASNDEIATSLFISINTVKHHVHNILSKLDLENRKQAVHYAQQTGLLN